MQQKTNKLGNIGDQLRRKPFDLKSEVDEKIHCPHPAIDQEVTFTVKRKQHILDGHPEVDLNHVSNAIADVDSKAFTNTQQRPGVFLRGNDRNYYAPAEKITVIVGFSSETDNKYSVVTAYYDSNDPNTNEL